MNVDSLSLLRHSYLSAVREASHIIREHAKAHGAQATMAFYGFDQYEYTSALHGSVPTMWELRVLELQESIDKRDSV